MKSAISQFLLRIFGGRKRRKMSAERKTFDETIVSIVDRDRDDDAAKLLNELLAKGRVIVRDYSHARQIAMCCGNTMSMIKTEANIDAAVSMQFEDLKKDKFGFSQCILGGQV